VLEARDILLRGFDLTLRLPYGIALITRTCISPRNGLALPHTMDRGFFSGFDLGRMCALRTDHLPLGKTAIECRDVSIMKHPYAIGERAE